MGRGNILPHRFTMYVTGLRVPRVARSLTRTGILSPAVRPTFSSVQTRPDQIKLKPAKCGFEFYGAGDRVRTDDNWYHKPALYQLSYTRHKLLCPDLFGLALIFQSLALPAVKNRGGADQTRTDDPLHAMQVLYQLSYNPAIFYPSILR